MGRHLRRKAEERLEEPKTVVHMAAGVRKAVEERIAAGDIHLAAGNPAEDSRPAGDNRLAAFLPVDTDAQRSNLHQYTIAR